ncbi:MAG: hypothetical protein WCH99_05415 [Verrucomicrobiota bacterium]
MKNWIKTSALGLIAAIILCLAARAQLNSLIQGTNTPAPDSIVQITADAMGLEPVAYADLPRGGGTFWWVEASGVMAPLPCPPMNRVAPIYAIAEGHFLVDDTCGQVALNTRTINRMQSTTTSLTVSAVDRLGNAVADLIEQIQQTQFERSMMLSLGVPMPGDGGGGGTNSGDNGYYSTYTIDTNLMWLEITNVSNGWSHLNLHSGTNPFTTSQVFAIWTKTNLLDATWNTEKIVSPTADQTDVMPFSLQNFDRPILFFKVQDWTGVDSDSDGIPDWWAWNYFGTINVTDTNLDYSGSGQTFAQDFSSSTPPTVFKFTGIEIPNNYVSSSQPAVQLDVAGTPYYIATLVDDHNFSNAVWTTYSGSTVTVNLDSVQGWHEVWIGLRGHADNPENAVWQRKCLKLDWTPPTIVITNPAGGTVDIPMIQVQGYSPEALSSITYDLSNAAGTETNLPVLILNQFFSTNTLEFTTNTFQAFDVMLTNGVNVLTLHAADLAGNVTTLTTNFTVDYSGKTNPPTIQILWPQDGMQVSGSNATVRGLVDDATVIVTASITDLDGNTNTVTGIVERNGRFWLENMPLNSGTNIVSIIASDVAGNQTMTNLTLLRSAVTVTVNDLDNPSDLWQATVNLTGTISDPTYAVWVNGVQGINHGDGTWSAENVPTTIGGVAIFNVAVYPPSEAPAASSGGNGENPTTPNASQSTGNSDKPTRMYVDYHYQSCRSSDDSGWKGYDANGVLKDSLIDNTATFHRHFWFDGDESYGSGSGEDNLTSYYYGITNGYAHQWTEEMIWPKCYWPNLTSGTHTATGDYDWETFDSIVDPPAIGWEHCNVKNPINSHWEEDDDGLHYQGWDNSEYTRFAQTKVRLQTGGKAIPGRQSLWCFTGGATKILDKQAQPPFGLASTEEITNKTRITIGAMGKLGADGKRWVALPDGQDLNVTPEVGEDFYTFSVSWQKYKLTILANDYPLAEDRVRPQAYYCVGQKIGFECVFSPSVPDLDYTNPAWNYTADYINNHWTDANGCEEYNIAPVPAMSNPTAAWFYNKQTQDATANLGMYCKFNNGQSVYLVRKGKFNVFTPSTQFNPLWLGTPQVVIDSGRLSLGSVNLETGTVPDMSFQHYIKTEYSGTAGYTQLISGEYDDDFSVTCDGYELDNTEYPRGQSTIAASQIYNVNVPFDDGPNISLATINHGTSMKLLFKTYLRFKPNVGNPSDNIFVTLSIVTWGVKGSATFNNGWSLDVGNTTSGPSDSAVNDFPIWSKVLHNMFTSH